jgi:hypothetical protein
MAVSFFRRLRRKRVIMLQEDLDFGIKKIMRERWDSLTLIEIYQDLEELESLIRKDKIVDESAARSFLKEIEAIKRTYPFDKGFSQPSWDLNNFLHEIICLAGSVKRALLTPPDNLSLLPPYSPIARAWDVLNRFYSLAQKRSDNIKEEEERITTFILIALKKHIYYMQFLIDLLLIVVGIVIGWLFSR